LAEKGAGPAQERDPPMIEGGLGLRATAGVESSRPDHSEPVTEWGAQPAELSLAPYVGCSGGEGGV
jgi:hypothetical protein